MKPRKWPVPGVVSQPRCPSAAGRCSEHPWVGWTCWVPRAGAHQLRPALCPSSMPGFPEGTLAQFCSRSSPLGQRGSVQPVPRWQERAGLHIPVNATSCSETRCRLCCRRAGNGAWLKNSICGLWGFFGAFFLQFSVMTPGVAPRSYAAVPEGTVTQCRSGQELPGMRISSVGVATKDIVA